MAKKIYISVLFILIGLRFGISQETRQYNRPFEVSLKVIDKNTQKPIENAEVTINGELFRYRPNFGTYRITARRGDELVIVHPDFETVFYTIKNDEDIKVEVKEFYGNRRSRKGNKRVEKSYFRMSVSEEPKVDEYNVNLDSAKYYKEKNIDKSLSFIEDILAEKETNNRNAATYTTLGNIYFYWKQYDLAIANYVNSLNYKYSANTNILLGQTYVVSKNYTLAETTFDEVLNKKLTKYESILTYEGLGDAFFGLKEYPKSKESYQKGLKIATDNDIKSKITDLNSKIGEVYGAEGNLIQAKKSFTNSINSAKTENLKRSLKVQDKVADFYNSNSQFDDEIQLRKITLNDILEKDSISIDYDANDRPIFNGAVTKQQKLSNLEGFISFDGLEISQQDSLLTFSSSANTITPQSLNYKIGRAYTQKEDYQKAIPYLQNSINNPGRPDNLEIKKDATRKLSETFATVGDYDKALKSYQDYVALVDKAYIRKEQEIAQAKRFARKIADNQNRIASLEKDKAFKSTKIDLAYKDQQLSEERNRNQLILIYSLIAGLIGLVTVASLLFRSNRQQKLANNLLALKSMRSQMNPHFIFNALNSVNSFIAVNDERNANRYLSEFSVLMRSVLENSDEDFIPLSKEIELLELYVKLEHNRFKDKFNYTVDVDKEIDLDQFSIPPMLLQPYIENAIWHGLRYKKEMGKLSINISQKDVDTVQICIQDDGVGRKKSMALKTKNQLKQKSKGMSTIKNRVAILNDMYEDRISVQVSDLFDTGEGTKVELLLRKN
ncbi:histidine kinase [Flavobacteriaceae bacterium S356]|uniref:Histidine kinase n=1 Tax=Asprobacillus argus TaxID=3076534 RepID=A0ABU3LFN8_9FLAO|nr:histidine kinase [Flavobacteriaceae bacterium S356]